MKRASAAVLAAAVLTCAGGEVRGQLLAYESFEPVDGGEYGAWVGRETVSTGFVAGGWRSSAGMDEGMNFVLDRTHYTEQTTLRTSGWSGRGGFTGAVIGRRVEMSDPALDGFRSEGSGAGGAGAFGLAGTTVWMAAALRVMISGWETFEEYAASDGRSELVLHRGAEAGSDAEPALRVSVGAPAWGLRAGAGTESVRPVAVDVFEQRRRIAVKFEYGEDSTRVSLYVNPPTYREQGFLKPTWQSEVRNGDPRAPSGVLAWDAVSIRPWAGGGVAVPRPGAGVHVQIEDLRIGGTAADVLPTTSNSYWIGDRSVPEWTGADGGRWGDAGNWSGGKVPDDAGGGVIFGPGGGGEVVVEDFKRVRYVRFDSAAGYRVAGAGGLMAGGEADEQGAEVSWGFRFIDVRRGSHAIDVPLWGMNTSTTVYTEAGASLALGEVRSYELVSEGAGEVVVRGGVRTSSCFIDARDTSTLVLRSNRAGVPAVSMPFSALEMAAMKVASGATMRLGVPGDRVPTWLNDYFATWDVAGRVVVEDVAAGMRPSMLGVGAFTLNDPGWVIRPGGVMDVGTSYLAIVTPQALDAPWREWIATARGEGNWDGWGITSRYAGGLLSLGWANGGEWPVQAVVALTYEGDANLDGVVDDLDLAVLTASLADPAAGAGGWPAGDFDYSGVVDAADVGLYWAGRSGQGSPLGLSAVVPEAGWAGVGVGVCALGVIRRRRR